MKDLETLHRINHTSESEARQAAIPWTYANGLDKPPVQKEGPQGPQGPQGRTMNGLDKPAVQALTLTRPEVLILSEALAVFRPTNDQDEDTRQKLIVRLGMRS